MDNINDLIIQEGSPSSAVGSIFSLFANPCEVRILQSLRQIVRAIEVHSRRLEHDFQITGPQMGCLLVIQETGPIAVTHLAAKVFLSPGTVVGIVDRLEEKSLVQRVRSTKDRRLVEVGITEEGRATIERTPHPLQGALGAALREISDRDQVDIAVALEKLVISMGKKGGPAEIPVPPCTGVMGNMGL